MLSQFKVFFSSSFSLPTSFLLSPPPPPSSPHLSSSLISENRWLHTFLPIDAIPPRSCLIYHMAGSLYESWLARGKGTERWERRSEADERTGAQNDRDHHDYITSVKATDSQKTAGCSSSVYLRHSFCLCTFMSKNGHMHQLRYRHSCHLGYISGLMEPGFGFSQTVKQLRPFRFGVLLHSSDPAC